MRINNKYLMCILAFMLSLQSKAEEGHEHEEGEAHEESQKEDSSHEEHSDHKDSHDEHEEEEASASVGPGKAIEEASPKLGFKLSEKALKTIGIKTQKVIDPKKLSVPRSSIVTFGEDRGIYRFRNNFFKNLDFKILEKNKTAWLIQVNDLVAGDEIVTEGTGLLRVAELEATGGGAGGHDH